MYAFHIFKDKLTLIYEGNEKGKFNKFCIQLTTNIDLYT